MLANETTIQKNSNEVHLTHFRKSYCKNETNLYRIVGYSSVDPPQTWLQ